MQKQPEVKRLNFLIFMTEQLSNDNRFKMGTHGGPYFMFHGFLNDCPAFNV